MDQDEDEQQHERSRALLFAWVILTAAAFTAIGFAFGVHYVLGLIIRHADFAGL